MVAGRPPALDLELERDVQDGAPRGASARGLVKSAHDCSEGGIAVALAESCIAGGIGADVHLARRPAPGRVAVRRDAGRIVVDASPTPTPRRSSTILLSHEVPYSVIGTVGGDALTHLRAARRRRSTTCATPSSRRSSGSCTARS